MKNFFIALASVSLFSCNQNDRSAADTTKVQSEIKSTIDSYNNDIRKEGLRGQLKYLDSSKNFFWVPPGYLNYANYDTIVSAIGRHASSLKSIDNRYDSLLIIPLTDEYAQFVMRTISNSVTAGGDTIRSAFIESGVMVKRKEGWKFLSGQTSLLD